MTDIAVVAYGTTALIPTFAALNPGYIHG